MIFHSAFFHILKKQHLSHLCLQQKGYTSPDVSMTFEKQGLPVVVGVFVNGLSE
jgi:hypothetical protein